MMEPKVSGQKRRKYDASFKAEVLKMVVNGRPVAEVAQSLGVGENLIYKWKSRGSQPPTVTTVGTAAAQVQVHPSSLEDQQRLHKRIQELEGERDILKKAVAIFTRQT